MGRHRLGWCATGTIPGEGGRKLPRSRDAFLAHCARVEMLSASRPSTRYLGMKADLLTPRWPGAQAIDKPLKPIGESILRRLVAGSYRYRENQIRRLIVLAPVTESYRYSDIETGATFCGRSQF